MANSKRFVVKNGLETQNIQFVEVDGTETITLTVLDDGSLSFSGSSGQLFSITDSLTGSIFSVNDISGIPSIEVFDDGKVILAESTGNVGIGILTPTHKLHVAGNINISSGSKYKINGVDLSAADVGAASSSHTHLLAAGATDVTATATELNVLDGITATTTELNYTDGVTSAIQTQLNAKVNTSSIGAPSGIAALDANSKILVSNLPNSVFDSLFYYTTFSINSLARVLADNAIQNAIAINRSPNGYYWVQNSGSTRTLTPNSTAIEFPSASGRFHIAIIAPAEEGVSASTDTAVTMENGDWVVLNSVTGTGTSLDPYISVFAVVNNTYENASTTVDGIVRLSSQTAYASLSGNNVVTDGVLKTVIDNAAFALDSSVVKLTGDQSIAGTKTFTGNVNISGVLDLTNTNVTGALDLSNNNIVGVNNIEITDPGPNEGISWAGGNLWRIWESPNDLTTNSGGNLQIVQNTTRRATFNTSGQLEIPVATGTAPLSVSSTTAVTNLNADLLDGLHESSFLRSDANDSFSGWIQVSNNNGLYVDGANATLNMDLDVSTNTFNVRGTSNNNIFTVYAGDNSVRGDKVTLGARSTSTYGGNTAGLTLNSVAELRSLQASNAPALTFHYENLATRHILMASNGDINVVSPSSENSGVAVLKVNGNTVWHEGNDGTGSGLDADLLDGNHASAFALDNSVVKLTGNQTITGEKIFQNSNTFFNNLTTGTRVFLGSAQLASNNERGLYEDGGDVPLAVWNPDNGVLFYGGTDLLDINTSTRKIGVNTLTPSAKFEVKSDTTTVVPLITDTVASHTADLAQFKLNGATKLKIDKDGTLRGAGDGYISIGYSTQAIRIETTADNAYTPLIVNKNDTNTSADLQEWQYGSETVSYVSEDGYYAGAGIQNISGQNNSLIQTLSTGTYVYRNINDANPALVINQQQGTGNIANFQFNSANKVVITKDGNVGIGTSTPGEKLSVEGNTYVKDRLIIGLEDATHDSIYLENSVGSPDGKNGLYSNNGDQSIAVFDGSNNSWHYANSNLIYTESTDTFALNGNLTVNGNIINTGSTITVNTSNLTVTDKNIELGFITPKTGLVATLATGTANITLTTGTTEGMIPGQALTKTAGTGVFGASARIATITGLTTLTATVNHATAGSITFTASGATDFTADGGGITLKGDNDHTLTYTRSNGSWTFSDRLYLLNEDPSGDKLVIEDTDLEYGSAVKITSNSSTVAGGEAVNLLNLFYNGTTSSSAPEIYGVNSLVYAQTTNHSTAPNYAYGGQFIANFATHNYGILASASGTTGSLTSYGVQAYADGPSGSTVYAIKASVGTTPTTRYTFHGTNGILYNSDSVGIGTDAPLNKLEVRITGADSNDGIMITRADTTTTTNEILGGIGFDSTDGNVPSSVLEASAYIAAFAAEDHSTGDKGGYLTFGTSPIDQDDDTVSTERMRITSQGLVGIGTNNPETTLHVNGESLITNTAFFQPVGSGGNRLYIGNANLFGATEMGLYENGGDAALAVYNPANGFMYYGNGQIVADVGTGKVGIGTLTPSAKLDVAGDIEHTGLTMTSGTNVDQLKQTTFTSALTTAWTDVTGVSGTYLATGSHIVQIISNGEYYTGEMSWFSGTTTSTVADEIILHRAGPAASAGRIFARVIRTSSAPSTLKLQVSGSTSISSHTMTFKFRRTI